MTIKIVNSLKSVIVFGLLLISVIACEKDFENIGVNIVDNNLFNTKDTVFELVSYTKDVERSRVDGLPVYNIGVINDDNFGLLEASFVSQVGLPLNTSVDFGLNPVIDEVILDIPYFATLDSLHNNGTPKFILDSVFGNKEVGYQLKVHQLATFLNSLDPLDPTKPKRYYSDEDYSSVIELYSENNFMPSDTDTVLYVERPLVFKDTVIGLDTIKVRDLDIIKKSPLAPSIKLPLDKNKIKNIFIDDATEGDFQSFDNFTNYFRGIFIETDGIEGSLMTLAMNDATINIYYTNEILTDETDTDLNGDGDTDDLQVPVKTKQTMTFSLSGIRANSLKRNYGMATSNIQAQFSAPDTDFGHEKLFVQGAEGSNAIIELFKDVDTTAIRNQNWLINGAILDVYVDNIDNKVPSRLYLYNVDDNAIILDVISEALVTGIDGFLDFGEDEKPLKYQFLITDYISEILRSDNPRKLSKLAIKTFNAFDVPQSAIDTIVKDFSWEARGVVLKGNKLPLSDDTRFKLKIFYTVD